MIQVKVCNDDNIHELVYALLLTDMAKVWVFLHVCVLHVNANVEYYCPILNFAHNA